MRTKQTKALENALALGVLASGRHGGNPADWAFLTLLKDNSARLVHILERFMKDWELQQAKMRIIKELEGLTPFGAGETNAEMESLYDSLKVLAKENAGPDGDTADSGHLLLHILGDSKYVTSRILSMYGISCAGVLKLLPEITCGESGRDTQESAPRIHILRITPPEMKSSENDGAEEWDEETDAEEAESLSAPKQEKKRSAGLEKYGMDLTQAALRGEIDPVVGREKEIERLIQILGRRKKNNPILIGEAGVGKSAIAEGLALRLASRDVPPALYGKSVFSLDVASMVAGTKYRGQFEERIKNFMKELRKNRNVILFIDEIHTIVGAGSTQGSLDTANILKPALARGELQCIGATTLDEYRENIEKDSALERRFQKIIVEPASREETLKILENIKDKYERHHSVRYSAEALTACVELTDRYVTDRHFPDKAIDVMDEAGSKASLRRTCDSGLLRELEDALHSAAEEKRRAAALMKYNEASHARIKELALADRISEIRSDRQRESSMNPEVIEACHIRDIVSMMTGIPLQDVSQSEKSRLRDMAAHLGSVVMGQPEAVGKVTRSVQRSRAGLKDPGKPIGVFMFVGPTGVGKTLLAKELSKWMFGRPEALVRIDMSEYSEKHNVSRLIGSPPGYVGYNEGGQLTETIRRQPYAVILLDEIEKAHPDVFNIMLQIFDDGQLTDGSGRKVDFRNTVIIMTSNVGSRKAAAKTPVIGYGCDEVASVQAADDESGFRSALESRFAPEFLNRIDDIVLFNALLPEQVKDIVGLELSKLCARAQAMGYTVRATEKAISELASKGYEPRYGARSLKRTILELVEEPLAAMIVAEEALPGDKVSIDLSGGRITLRVKKKKCPASA